VMGERVLRLNFIVVDKIIRHAYRHDE
jgi:hypothetical protein